MPGVQERNEVIISSERSKRDMSLAERGKLCKDLEISQKVFSMASDVLGDINSMPMASQTVGMVTAGMAIVGHLTAGSLDIAQTALDCADVPFEELKEFMQKQFNEVNRKLDSNSAALEAVSKAVTQTLSAVEETREEMNERFDEVLMSIEETKIEPTVSKISNFVRYFQSEKDRIRGLKQHEYVAKLEEKNSILLFFRESRTPASDNSLNSALFDIIKHGYAMPDSNEDEISFKALYALLYGTEAHVSVMTFLIEQYSFLANYHYERGEIDEYREYFDAINNVFLEFRSSLVGSRTSKSENLLDQVIKTLTDITKVDFLILEREDIIQMLNNKIKTFEKIKQDISGMVLTLITDTPQNYVQISFDTNIPIPFGEWEYHAKVSYAVQYRHEGAFSRIGDWSDPVTVNTKACPTLRMPVDQSRRAVLIFRKFENSKPQLVGSVEPYQEKFVDINRDLYNAASNPDNVAGSKAAKMLLKNGASASIKFEKGRKTLHAAAQSGNSEIALGILLRGNSEEINEPDDDGYTPLHVAAKSGNSGFVKFLLNYDASVNVKTNQKHLTPLHLAASGGFQKTFDRLLESPEININQRNIDGFTPLHHAVLGGQFIVDAFVRNKNTEINPKSTKKELTPFHLAVINNYLPVAKSLMKSQQVEINAGDKDNMTPLHYAAMLGHSDMMKYLLSLDGINPNRETKNNKWSPLHYAIFFKHDDIALNLLNSPNIDYSLKADGGSTPLHFAVAFGKQNVLLKLFTKNVNLEAVTKEGYTPLHLSALKEDPDILSILLDNGANIEAKTINESTPLHLATFAGRSQTALTLLERGANLKVSDKNGQTPLHGAALNDQLEVIQKLLSRDHSILDLKNKNSDTALNVAAQNSRTAIAKYLINQRADINTRNNDGISPLIGFAKTGNQNMVKYLIDKGADVYTADNNGTNFIYHAVRNDHLNVVEYARHLNKINWDKIDDKRKEECSEKCSIQHFAVCDSIKYHNIEIVKYLVREFKQSTCEPLTEAVRFGWLDIVKYLVDEKGMDVNPYKDYYNPYNTPLCNAAISGNLEIVKYLVEHKANMYTNCKYALAIDKAIEHNHLNIVKFLCENGYDLRRKNRFQDTPLEVTFSYGRYEILKYFIEERTNDIDINHRNSLGNTLLISSVRANRLDLVKILVEKGADVMAKNKDGATALDAAKWERKYHIVDYLQPISRRFYKKTVNSNVSNFSSDAQLTKGIGYMNHKFIGGEKESSRMQRSKAQNVDVIGTLILLDVMIRHFTNQKYIDKGDESVSEADAQATALKIAEKFEDFLNLSQNLKAEAQIDFSEVHKNVYKALKNGKQNQIHQILCSSMETLSNLALEEKEKLMSEVMSTHSSEVSSLRRLEVDETFSLLTQQCLGSERSSIFKLIK